MDPQMSAIFSEVTLSKYIFYARYEQKKDFIFHALGFYI
jgi:hypothetical protein